MDTGREVKTNYTVTSMKCKEQNKRCEEIMAHMISNARCGETYIVFDVDVGAGFYQQLHYCHVNPGNGRVERRIAVLVCTELDVITEEG